MSRAMSTPRGGGMGDGKRAKTPMKTLKRLLVYAFSKNKLATCFVVFFVLLASVANVLAASRVSEIITALLDNGRNIDLWAVVYPNIIAMGCIYLVGVASSMAYNLIMMYIAQGTLKKMRIEMFAKMQNLPLKYFDTHTHGDLMSLYTNDVDTMRQLLSQTIPQLISSIITLISVLVFMVLFSVTLLIVVLLVLVAVVFATKHIAGRSAKYYITHQKALGKLNGYVEEMTEGQKVIKVFCHEQKAREDFKKLNDDLNDAGRIANSYAFILGPVNNNLGYISYVLVAVIGVIMMYCVGETGLLSIYCS
ncbi:MAG: ABC transporter ATP-binding protein, partial [Clostridia bacterium]|nr:ABC transporter ATP-binding protein [Clostridia bacterium]